MFFLRNQPDWIGYFVLPTIAYFTIKFIVEVI